MRRKETAGAIASYSKIAEALCKEIRAGVYSNEESFPSLTKIMQRFGVSRPSAVRSVAELKRLGLVSTRRGSGTFVAARNRTIGLAIPGTADSEFFLRREARRWRDHAARRLFRNRRSAQRHHLRHSRQGQYPGFGAGRKIAAHLLGVGAKRICCLLRSLCADSVRARFSGVDAEVCRSRRGRHVNVVVAEPDDKKAIDAMMKELRPDAIVCSNDIAASNLVKTLGKLRVRVPDDVMVAGFDDVRLAGSMSPGLTTIRQPCFDIASTAFKTLLERMATPNLPPRQILLDTTLVVRASTTRRA